VYDYDNATGPLRYTNGIYRRINPGVRDVMVPDGIRTKDLDRLVRSKSGPVIIVKEGKKHDGTKAGA
jgi:hypothetical protein